MSNDDYDIARRRLAAQDASPEPYREALWSAVSRSWTDQVIRRERARAARTALGAAAALAAAVLVGVYIGRGAAPSPEFAAAVDAPVGTGLRAPYRLAVGDHLRAVEMLLVQFDEAAGASRDLRSLARNLAATTRLLADSRAGEDAEVRRMLLDVELLLVQIGRLVDEDAAAERQIVREGIEESTVLPRLRQLVAEQPPALGV